MLIPHQSVFPIPKNRRTVSLHPFEWPNYDGLLVNDATKRIHHPPIGHPYQCRGLDTVTLCRCQRWIAPSHPEWLPYCLDCAKSRPVTKIYDKQAGPQLKDLLIQAAEGAPEDRLSVLAEIDLARAAATQAVQLFNKVLENQATISVESRVGAMTLLHAALREVSKLVETQSRILSNIDGVMTVEQMLWVTESIKKLVRETVGSTDQVMAERICDRIDLIQPPNQSVAEKAVRISII